VYPQYNNNNKKELLSSKAGRSCIPVLVVAWPHKLPSVMPSALLIDEPSYIQEKGTYNTLLNGKSTGSPTVLIKILVAH
jgi:hypothetical protein